MINKLLRVVGGVKNTQIKAAMVNLCWVRNQNVQKLDLNKTYKLGLPKRQADRERTSYFILL